VGQEIFYCWKCKSLLRTRDIEKGKAVRIGDQVSCEACAPDLGVVPAATPRPAPAEPLPTDSTRTRMSPVPGKTPRRGTAASKGSPLTMLYAGGGILVLVVLGVIAAVSSSGKPPTRPPSGATPETVSVEPEPPKRPDPVPPSEPVRRPPPREAAREAEAKKALEDLRAFMSASPKDLKGQLERATRASFLADGPGAADVQTLLAQIKKEIGVFVAAELKALDERLREPQAKGEFGEGLRMLAEARLAHPFADWGAGIDERAKQLTDGARKSLDGLKERIIDARRRGADDEARALAAGTARLGLAAAKEEIDRVLAQPVEVLPSKEALSYRKRWEEAAALWAPRDYGAMIKALEAPPAWTEERVKAEAAANLEALRLAADVPREALAMLPKWNRGQLMRFIMNDDLYVEGKLLRQNAAEIELLRDEDVAHVVVSEIAPCILSELYGMRATKKPEDDRAAMLFHLLEGDLPEAEKRSKEKSLSAPEDLKALGRKAAEARAEPKEVAARKLFIAAEAEFRKPGTRGAAGEKFRALLAEHAGTSFLKRLKPIVEARAEASKESFFWAEDLIGAGTFSISDHAKVESCWMALSESAPGKAPSNYVEFEYYGQPDVAPRAWVYVGGCCLEVFGFALQATDLTMPNPKDPKEALACDLGSTHAVPVKNALALKRLHSAHGGPKEPARWTWLPLPLPKPATAGLKKARLVTEQQGFSVAYVLVATGRTAPLRDAELKDLEKARTAHRELLGYGKDVPTGSILREYWTGVGGAVVADLAKHPGWPDKPSGSNLITSLEIPAEWADNYGTRIRGYVHPPLTGNYVFWLASDDGAEVWLSSDDSPARKTRICWLETAVLPKAWDALPQQKSAPIPLAAGRRYFLEILHKEGNINDHLAVGWQLPSGQMERPIPGSRLSPFGTSGRGTKPSFYRGVNLNGPPLTIDGRAWEGKGAANVTWNGEFENQAVPLTPPLEGPKAQMIRSSAFNGGGTTVTLSAVPSGTYQVYLYVWEDNSSETYDLFLEGKVVLEKYKSGAAGHWERLGPWSAEITDGTIELRTAGGHANLSGVEVWRLK
jgi:hypothetical protein